MNFVSSNNNYEVLISIDDTKSVAGSLLFKSFKHKLMAFIYYKYLSYIINHKKILYLEKLIENTK